MADKKRKGQVITKVNVDSIAQEMGICPGDELLEVNGRYMEDVFDYRYEMNDEQVQVLIKKQNGEEWLLEIEKEYEEDLGVEFESGLMSDYKSCQNQCIFCFIDQMPKGMRDTLYFKDDDSRLSFLQGNYITLTNMKERDVERIIRFHLAPVNISVHTTNPELRCRMLRNRFAGKTLEYLKQFYENGIEMNVQIVLCRGINDGRELENTIKDLERYIPVMQSVSVVPAGVTKFREGLYPLEPFSREEARAVIGFVEEKQKEFLSRYGIHFVHASDEFYWIAELEVPEGERYDGYIQLENGVGMVRLLEDEVTEELKRLREHTQHPDLPDRKVTIATGEISYPLLCRLGQNIMEVFPQLQIQVVPIKNDFFGNSITVTGLITGQDLVRQLREKQKEGYELGECVLISAYMFRTGERVFLDDVTQAQVEEALGVRLCPVDSSGKDFVNAVCHPDYRMERINDGFVYVS